MDKPQYRIGFIGIGVLGKGLALALSTQDYSVSAAYSRRVASAQGLGAWISGLKACSTAQELADSCDIVFITTPDSAIGEVAASVQWHQGQGVVHCSGALSTGVLNSATEQAASTGGLHPFQTFAGLDSPKETVRRLSGVSFAVAGDGWLYEFLVTLVRDLGGYPVTIPEQYRPLYHASAILGCGYLAALLETAIVPWRAMGFSEEEARRALVPLAKATLENIARKGIRDSLTGPIVRGDVATISAHLEALAGSVPETVPVYRALTAASLDLAAQRGVPPQQLEEMKNLACDAQWRYGPCPE